MAEHNILGKEGELLAKQYLIKKGYQIVAQNYRYRKAEVDLIAIYKNEVIAIEVKTRSSNDFGNPEDFVSKKQIKNLCSAMNYFVQSQQINLEIRFDIISILKQPHQTEIKHLEDAFYIF